LHAIWVTVVIFETKDHWITWQTTINRTAVDFFFNFASEWQLLRLF
jgi:hypothetical protein